MQENEIKKEKSSIKLLIVIPCYNEEKRLHADKIEYFFAKRNKDNYQLLFVNDGSTDNTLSVLKNIGDRHENIEVLDLKQNVGKAEAIRQGMLHKLNESYDYLGYFDADLATPLNEIDRFVEIAQKKTPLFILGSRIKILGTTNISRKLSRHYIGRVFATIVSNMLHLSIYDTQCGAKLIHKDAASLIFKEAFLSKWLFDVELLFRLRKEFELVEERIVEVPVRKWEDIGGSKINTSYFFKAPLDLLRIYLKYK